MIRYDQKNPNSLPGFKNTKWTQISANQYIKTGTSQGSSGGSLTTGSTSLSLTQIPAHTHSFSGSSASAGDHTHGLSKVSTNTTGGHAHSVWIGAATSGTGNSTWADQLSTTSTEKGWPKYDTNKQGNHAHTLIGVTDSSGSHSHTISGTIGSSGGSGGHTHTINPPFITLVVWYRTS